MDQADDPRPPLADWILDVYTVLSIHLTGVETADRRVSAISRDQAVQVLVTTDELALESEDADYALTRLLECGYFYEVDDELRVTAPSE
jgi:hypothetical protein